MDILFILDCSWVTHHWNMRAVGSLLPILTQDFQSPSHVFLTTKAIKTTNQWEFQDPIDGGTLVPYKAIFSGGIPKNIGLMKYRPYIWYNVRPPSYVCWFINPINYSYLRTINHRYWSYVHQLSYLGGLTLYLWLLMMHVLSVFLAFFPERWNVTTFISVEAAMRFLHFHQMRLTKQTFCFLVGFSLQYLTNLG